MFDRVVIKGYRTMSIMESFLRVNELELVSQKFCNSRIIAQPPEFVYFVEVLSTSVDLIKAL